MKHSLSMPLLFARRRRGVLRELHSPACASQVAMDTGVEPVSRSHATSGGEYGSRPRSLPGRPVRGCGVSAWCFT